MMREICGKSLSITRKISQPSHMSVTMFRAAIRDKTRDKFTLLAWQQLFLIREQSLFVCLEVPLSLVMNGSINVRVLCENFRVVESVGIISVVLLLLVSLVMSTVWSD